MRILLFLIFLSLQVELLALHAKELAPDDNIQDIRHPEDFHKPFWKTKPEVQKKILKEDLIVVSADTDQLQKEPKLYEMKVVVGGAVTAPLNFTFKKITEYDKLKNVDSHFKESKYDKEKKILYLHLEALDYHARMHLRLNEIDVTKGKKKVKQIHWECIKGQFLGMKGIFQVEEIGRHKTEISMTANYRSETLPLPQVLMGLGLEVIGRQVAKEIRQYIKDQYKNR